LKVARALAAIVAVAPLLASAPALAADECPDVAEAGQDLRAKNRLLDARKAFIRCSAEGCPGVVRADCRRWLDEVDALVPSLVVAARRDGNDVVDARVTIDGKLVELGRPIELDPGPHVVRATRADGTGAVEQDVLVSAGAKGRNVVLELGAGKPSTRAPAAPEAPPPDKPSLVGPLAAAGVGVAGLAVFGIFQGLGRAGISDLENGCDRTKSCTASDIDPVRTQFTVSAVGLGVGAVGLVVGGVWYFVAGRSASAGAPPLTLRF